MRNQWRLLLLRNVSRSSSSFQNPTISLQARKVHQNFIHLSSFLGRNVYENTFDSDFKNPKFRYFSSESSSSEEGQKKEEVDYVVSTDVLSKSSSNDEINTGLEAVEQKKEGVDYVVVTDMLSKSSSNDEIRTGLESIDLSISHEMVFNTLRNLRENPDIAWKFFNFVSETENALLSSKSYNQMLNILGRKKSADQFWGLVETMKNKGYGISKWVHVRASENFEKNGMVEDLDKLKEFYVTKPDIEETCSKVCKIIRDNDWDVDAQNKLTELNVTWSNDLVTMVIEHSSEHPRKALMFFWWVEENPDFKHNKLSYSAILKVLGREDCIDKFWRIVREMKEAGYEMDVKVYELVMQRLYTRRMMKDAVDLYDFMVDGSTKPSIHDSIFLLRKLLVTKSDIDMDLFAKAVKIFADSGNTLSKSILEYFIKSLTSVSRVQEVDKILETMKNNGFVPDNEVYNRVIYLLGSVGKSEEAIQIIDEMEESEYKPDSKTWTSLINGLCDSLDVDKASSCFRTMIERIGATDAGPAFDKLVCRFCWNKRAEDAHKLLTEMVDKPKVDDRTELRPLHKTYKTLISKLLGHRKLNEALTLLRLMKKNDYPPYLDPFIAHISRLGTGADAMRFLRAVTDRRYPSKSVFIRMFEAFFKAGRQSEAQNFLGESPSHIRNHADVLTLFCNQTQLEDDDVSPVAA